ncbi:hypothetical protein EDD85DRAFT_961214 [Armillaria nabsnona]|nr:hypothetical protein EDD85DRAFT_961214 [Armillaria nabsnona]
MFKKSSTPGITLESAGLVALLDILVLAPGMHPPTRTPHRQRVGHTGYLVTAVVKQKQNSKGSENRHFDLSPPQSIIVFALVGSIRDWWAPAVLGMLVLSRTINVFVIKRRGSVWKGAEEEGRGDLLVVLSQDRWIRLQGDISDVKRVMAGQWLRDEDRVDRHVR